ncbi:unnamed protein product [Merluccius merluccius]
MVETGSAEARQTEGQPCVMLLLIHPRLPRSTQAGRPLYSYRGFGRWLQWRCGAGILRTDLSSSRRPTGEATRTPVNRDPQKLTADRGGRTRTPHF